MLFNETASLVDELINCYFKLTLVRSQMIFFTVLPVFDSVWFIYLSFKDDWESEIG